MDGGRQVRRNMKVNALDLGNGWRKTDKEKKVNALNLGNGWRKTGMEIYKSHIY